MPVGERASGTCQRCPGTHLLKSEVYLAGTTRAHVLPTRHVLRPTASLMIGSQKGIFPVPDTCDGPAQHAPASGITAGKAGYLPGELFPVTEFYLVLQLAYEAIITSYYLPT